MPERYTLYVLFCDEIYVSKHYKQLCVFWLCALKLFPTPNITRIVVFFFYTILKVTFFVQGIYRHMEVA